MALAANCDSHASQSPAADTGRCLLISPHEVRDEE
jgi:hypothetical protein